MLSSVMKTSKTFDAIIGSRHLSLNNMYYKTCNQEITIFMLAFKHFQVGIMACISYLLFLIFDA